MEASARAGSFVPPAAPGSNFLLVDKPGVVVHRSVPCAAHTALPPSDALTSSIQTPSKPLLVRSHAAEKEHNFDLAVAYQRAQQGLLLTDPHGQPIPVFLTPGKCM